ncbi:hypothetical protein NPIL_484091 [Nephila pilipes]|uniref:Uncharacterized protein n=1 Tax=Nephila pilipes TaxID=299642 RepID=A0A8X6PBP1_NEPPI|nr:hypothetical protein NPIL_484091 [Nephila pilipes]
MVVKEVGVEVLHHLPELGADGPQGPGGRGDERPFGGPEFQDYLVMGAPASRAPLLQVRSELTLGQQEALAVQQHAFLHADAQKAVHLEGISKNRSFKSA